MSKQKEKTINKWEQKGSSVWTINKYPEVSQISLLQNKYLGDGVSTKFLPPLKHVRPHLLRFLNVKFPGLKEPVQENANNAGKVSSSSYSNNWV